MVKSYMANRSTKSSTDVDMEPGGSFFFFFLIFILKKRQQLVKENMCYACEEQNLGISHLKSLAQHIDVNKEGFQEIPSLGHFLTLFFMRNGSGFPTISNP